MSEIVKAAVVLGVAIIIAVWGVVYYSPYQECVRAGEAGIQDMTADSKTRLRLMCQMGWRD